MKFDTTLKIEKIASKDETRYALNGVYHDKEAKKLVATNGHILVAIPVTENEHDDAGLMPLDAVKYARDAAKKNKASEAPNATIVDGKISIPMSGAAVPAVENVQFPEWQRVLPSFNPADRNVVTITLNAKYLAALADALGSRDDSLQLTFALDNAYGPVMVRAGTDNGNVGAIMPIRNSVNGDSRVNPATNPHIVDAAGKPRADNDEAAA